MIFRDTHEPLVCISRNICNECFDYDQSMTSEANMGSKCIPDLLPGFTLNCSMPACYHVPYRTYVCLQTNMERTRLSHKSKHDTFLNTEVCLINLTNKKKMRKKIHKKCFLESEEKKNTE